MLKNAYSLAKIGADTAEHERIFAKNLPKINNYPTGTLPGTASVAVKTVPSGGTRQNCKAGGLDFLLALLHALLVAQSSVNAGGLELFVVPKQLSWRNSSSSPNTKNLR